MRTSTPNSSPRSPPHLGGSAAGAGGLSSHSAQPATRSPPNLGGSAEGTGGLSSHSAQPTQRAKRQPRTQRQVCPLSERSERWGAENAPSHPCYGAKARFRSRWFTMAGAVFGGRGLDRITRSRLPGGGSACVPRDPRPSRCRAPDIRDRMGSKSDARGRRASRAR